MIVPCPSIDRDPCALYSKSCNVKKTALNAEAISIEKRRKKERDAISFRRQPGRAYQALGCFFGCVFESFSHCDRLITVNHGPYVYDYRAKANLWFSVGSLFQEEYA